MKIEAGQTLTTRSACDHDCVFSVQVVARKGSFATIIQNGETKRCKVRGGGNEAEYIRPQSYSMAPIFSAPIN